MPVFLTYDGSVNGDWIAHYALRLAARAADTALNLVYVEDAGVPAPRLLAGLKSIERQAAALGVAVTEEILPMRQGVLGGLTDYLPAGPKTVVVCGARVREGRRGYLRGTISERLMQLRRYNVLALRVVQPGLLGQPRLVLAPVADKADALANSLPILRLLAPDIRRLDLLHVVERRRTLLQGLPSSKAKRLREEALDVLHRVEAGLRERLALPKGGVELLARVADDWPGETILQANYLHSGLIFVEASRRGLAQHFLPGRPIETLLAQANCDVAVYRGVD